MTENRPEQPSSGGGVHETPVRTAGATTPQRREAEAQRRHDEHERQLADRRRAEYGGVNWGAAFFGWLVAIALSVLLASIVGAIAAAVGSSYSVTQTEAQRSAGTIGVATAITLLVILVIGYFAGGYVAGRMSRFDGGRQGVAVWLFGLLIAVVVVVIGVLFGREYDVFARVDLPSMPIPTDTATVGGLIALAAVILATLLAAFLGGKAGQRYHRKIDRINV